MAATSIDDGDAIGLDLNSTRLLEHLSIAKRPEHDDNMVYCGKLSRACQRCRQRKIKCDERKPECHRCQKSQIPCPGYRDLNDASFRNQTAQIIHKFREQTVSPEQSTAVTTRLYSPMPNMPQTCTLHLRHPTSDLGANFFFTRYLSEQGTIFSDYHAWLTELYSSNRPGGLFRAVVQAVGLTGLSNTCYAPDLACRAQEQYSQALAALKSVLNDPAQAKSDMALLAITLLMLLEMLNFKTWERYQCWTAHINAALALLELRGQEQFMRQRGTQLYMQVRSQILLACVQQQVAVPKALVQATYYFQASTMRHYWRQINVASPASITEICFRVVNLRAALRTGAITDPGVIRTVAMDIDDDLETWRTGLTPSWRYASVVSPPGTHCDDCFNGLRHVYPSLWIAEAWNNWRILRLLVNQMLMQTGVDLSETTKKQNAIRQLSSEVCLTVYNFAESPRILSLVQPLYVIASEAVNTINLRAFAVHQLRRIDASMGVRQASLLADTAAKTFNGCPTESTGT